MDPKDRVKKSKENITLDVPPEPNDNETIRREERRSIANMILARLDHYTDPDDDAFNPKMRRTLKSIADYIRSL